MKKNILEIAPLLAFNFIDIEIDEIKYKDYKRMLNENDGLIGLFSKYINKLHDSEVLSMSFNDKILSITLNDYMCRIFAETFIKIKNFNVNIEKLVFPVTLNFNNIDLSYNLVNEDGFIKEIEKVEINEYLYEQIISVKSNKIEIGINAWAKNFENNVGRSILILISASNIEVEEFQKKAWYDIFGDIGIEYYKYFVSQFENGRFISDISECSKLIEEFDNNKTKC